MGRGDGHLCAPLAGGIAAPCALATPAPPPPLPLPPLYSAAGGGRGLEEGGWRSRPAPAHPRRLCPARSPEEGEGGPSPPPLLAALLPSLRRSPTPLLPSLLLLSPLAFSLPLFFPSPSVLPLHPALSRRGGVGGCLPGYHRSSALPAVRTGGVSAATSAPSQWREWQRHPPRPPKSACNSRLGNTTPGSGESRLPLGTGTGCRHRECEAWVSLWPGTAARGGDTAHPALRADSGVPGRLGGAYRHLQAGCGGPGARSPRAALLDVSDRGSTHTF